MHGITTFLLFSVELEVSLIFKKRRGGGGGGGVCVWGGTRE